MRSRTWGSGVVLALVLLAGLSGAPAIAEDPQITDGELDAYRYPDSPLGQPAFKPPNPLLSNDAADILSVTFAKTPPRLTSHDAGYTLSLTVRGEPHSSFLYLVGGYFSDDCYVIHYLTAGKIRDANAFCPDGEKSRVLGQISGSMVSIKGHTISANFSYRQSHLPRELKADPELDLYTFSCPLRGQAWGCNDDLIDYAVGTSPFKL